jgi:hypothetical protein
VADATLEAKQADLNCAQKSFLSPLLGAALPPIQCRNGENATPCCNASLRRRARARRTRWCLIFLIELKNRCAHLAGVTHRVCLSDPVADPPRARGAARTRRSSSWPPSPAAPASDTTLLGRRAHVGTKDVDPRHLDHFPANGESWGAAVGRHDGPRHLSSMGVVREPTSYSAKGHA